MVNVVNLIKNVTLVIVMADKNCLSCKPLYILNDSTWIEGF